LFGGPEEDSNFLRQRGGIFPENVGPGIQGFPDIVKAVSTSVFAECPKMGYILGRSRFSEDTVGEDPF
jgi:hypothetical protein